MKYLDKVIINPGDKYFVYGPFSKKIWFKSLDKAIKFISLFSFILKYDERNENGFKIFIYNGEMKKYSSKEISENLSVKYSIKYSKYGFDRSITIAKDFSQIYSDRFVLNTECGLYWLAFDFDILYGNTANKFSNEEYVNSGDCYICKSRNQRLKVYTSCSEFNSKAYGIDEMNDVYNFDGEVICGYACDYYYEKLDFLDTVNIPSSIIPSVMLRKEEG